MLPPLLLLLLGAPAAPPPAAPAPRTAHFVFSWRGVPVGQVTLALEGRRFTYTSEHLHTRERHVGTRRRQQVRMLDAAGNVEGTGARPQALWLWRGPPAPGCVVAQEELTGREGPHCAGRSHAGRVEGTLRGEPFRATYAADGELQALSVGSAHFRRVPPGVQLRAPPDLFARGLPIERAAGGAPARPLALEPALPAGAPRSPLSAWRAAPARALAHEVNAQLPDKRPSDEDLGLGPDGTQDAPQAGDEGGAGGCLAHALRYARLAGALGQRVALVHGLVADADGRAYPHAWVRVGLEGGATLDLDPTSLEEVRPSTHLPLAVVAPDAGDVEAGERWLRLLSGAHRVVRR